MTLSSFLTKFRSCRGKLIKTKQNEKHSVRISVRRLKMTLACWIWTIWKMLTTVTFVGHLLHFLSPQFGHQALNCPSIRYIVPAKISPALPLCQKNWFCGKVHLDDFYRLLCSESPSWIHIGVKRISQACCPHHLKNMETNCKTKLWDEKQNRALLNRPRLATCREFPDIFVVVKLITYNRK